MVTLEVLEAQAEHIQFQVHQSHMLAEEAEEDTKALLEELEVLEAEEMAELIQELMVNQALQIEVVEAVAELQTVFKEVQEDLALLLFDSKRCN
jgi:hypothetical protein